MIVKKYGGKYSCLFCLICVSDFGFIKFCGGFFYDEVVFKC